MWSVLMWSSKLFWQVIWQKRSHRIGELAVYYPMMGPLGDLESTFRNGGYYQCGRCDPVNGPIVHFPETATLPSNSDPSAWQAAAVTMEKDVINVMYVAPEASSPNLLADLVSKGIVLIGGHYRISCAQNGPLQSARMQLRLLRSIWPDVIAGKGGMTVNAQLQLADINPNLFSTGRQRLVQSHE